MKIWFLGNFFFALKNVVLKNMIPFSKLLDLQYILTISISFEVFENLNYRKMGLLAIVQQIFCQIMGFWKFYNRYPGSLEGLRIYKIQENPAYNRRRWSQNRSRRYKICFARFVALGRQCGEQTIRYCRWLLLLEWMFWSAQGRVENGTGVFYRMKFDLIKILAKI